MGLIGFYLGYLPYVHFQQAIDGFIARNTFIRATNIPELITADPTGQKVVGVLYTAMLAGLLVLVRGQGGETNRRHTAGVSQRQHRRFGACVRSARSWAGRTHGSDQ